MTQQFAAPEPQLAAQEPFYVRLGDAFVIVSATLMSLAAGAWLIARLDFNLSYAILVALGTYCGLLLLHLLMRRTVMNSDSAKGHASEDGQIHWQTGAAAFEAALSRHNVEAESSAAADGEEEAVARPWSGALPMPQDRAPEGSQAFNFRPARTPYFEPSPAETDPPPAKERSAAGIGGLSGEINVEVIQDLIKKLADELNGSPSRGGDAAGASASGARPGARGDANTEAMISQSIAALEATADAMRVG